MPKKGNRKRLKFRPGDVCSESVTVADFANADPAVVKSGRVKKAVANAVEKEVKLLCGQEASQGSVQEVMSSGVSSDGLESGEDPEEAEPRAPTRKKKNKRRKEYSESSCHGDGEEYPVDVWLVLASYIRPEDVCRFALICRSSWTVTCTAAFWTRLYHRHYSLEAVLPYRLQPDSLDRKRCLRVRVIRSLFHLYEPFSQRIAHDPALPEATPTTLLGSKCLLCWYNKVVGSRPEQMWEFNFKFIKQQASGRKGGTRVLPMPRRYEDVHANPDSDCYLLQVTTLNFIRLNPAVMGMTLNLLTLSVSADMRHHRVRLLFQDSPLQGGRRRRAEQGGTLVVLDPVHSLKLMDWWHPQYPSSTST